MARLCKPNHYSGFPPSLSPYEARVVSGRLLLSGSWPDHFHLYNRFLWKGYGGFCVVRIVFWEIEEARKARSEPPIIVLLSPLFIRVISSSKSATEVDPAHVAERKSPHRMNHVLHVSRLANIGLPLFKFERLHNPSVRSPRCPVTLYEPI